MSKRFIAALTVGLAIPAFVLSRVIWPDPPGTAAPPPGLLPLLMVPAIFEALAFGVGVAFLISTGRALVRHQAGRLSVAAIGTYLYTTIVQQRTAAVDRGTHAAPAQARP